MELTVYCSQPASGQMATFLQAVSRAHTIVVRPVTALPAPDPLRRQALRVERGELLDAIQAAETSLELLRTRRVQPDAGRENGLRFTLNSLNNRLKGVNTVLGSTAKGAVDNA
jgi:hypothetical protein